MSGHSKWATIKHQKGVTDARRGQLFTKLAREIAVTARAGGPNPEFNFRLRLVIQKAKDSNMPADNIDRAIKRGAGAGEGGVGLEEVTYEGYGPGGVAILVQSLTDNRNRTTSEVRNVFSRYGGSLGASGSVAWQFQPKGIVTIQSSQEMLEELALRAIDAGAEDVKLEEGYLEVYCLPGVLERVRAALEEVEAPISSAELSMLPSATVHLDVKRAEQALRLLDRLEELDDVQKVFANADYPDEVLERYKKEG